MRQKKMRTHFLKNDPQRPLCEKKRLGTEEDLRFGVGVKICHPRRKTLRAGRTCLLPALPEL